MASFTKVILLLMLIVVVSSIAIDAQGDEIEQVDQNEFELADNEQQVEQDEPQIQQVDNTNEQENKYKQQIDNTTPLIGQNREQADQNRPQLDENHTNQNEPKDIEENVREELTSTKEEEAFEVTSLPGWAPCDYDLDPTLSCYDCKTRKICTPVGGRLVNCWNPFKPYCNKGICSYVPSIECLKYR